MTVPVEDRPRYRDRKGDISTNVLATCDSNLRFTYVLPGWEGSASDPRVLRDALRRPNGLKIPRSKSVNVFSLKYNYFIMNIKLQIYYLIMQTNIFLWIWAFQIVRDF